MEESPIEKERRRRLIVVTSTFPSSPDDGTPAFVLDLVTGLRSAYDVTVVAPRSRGPAHRWEGFRVVRFAYFFRRFEGLADGAIMPNLRRFRWRWLEVVPFLIAMTWSTIVEARRAPRGGVISAQWIVPGGLAALTASKVSGCPFIVTVHGADVHTLRGRLARRLKALILRRAQHVLPVSSSIRDDILRIAPGLDERVLDRPLPMGIRPLKREAQMRKTSEFLFVGRIAEKKGLDVAIRALGIATEASLRVVGDGPLESSMKDLAALSGVADRVAFLGRMSRTSVLDELSRCGALVIPSVTAIDGDEDGTPVVLAEGLALGTPVIASAIGGMPEHLRDGENGFLTPPGDHVALANYLRTAIDNPRLFQKAGNRGRLEFAGGPLDMDTTVDGYLGVLAAIHG